jgi:cellulose synthase/poly-beta-1,6-N-acetylglucosamine synthase-like glycosyltransferase
MTALLLWTGLGLIGYAYVGFPLLLALRGRWARRPVARGPITPRVSVVIVAHNEAATIEAKLYNVYALDYPADRLEVIVASDGSDDGTDERAAAYVPRGLRLRVFPRGGKIPALNAAVAGATGDVLVFSDANSMYSENALRELVAPFADPAVGAVGGNQCYVSERGGHMASVGERLYWWYDRTLKSLQSRSGSMTAATGAIHAIRRELFRPVPPGVSDDFMISTRAVRAGYRLAFAERAVAYETVSPSEGAELSRKVRIASRGLRGLWVARELLNPLRHGFYAVQLASHKLLRWSVCWLLLLVMATSAALYRDADVYRWLAQAQLAFYGCALGAMALRHTALSRYRAFRLFGIPFYFCLANYAALRAWLRVLGGQRLDLWDSHRPHPAGGAAVGA